MDKNCPVCFGIGWVCENHPDRAWHEELGCMCGAGMPCECTWPESLIDEPGVSQLMIFRVDRFSLQLWITFLAQLLGVFARGMLSALISATREPQHLIHESEHLG